MRKRIGKRLAFRTLAAKKLLEEHHSRPAYKHDFLVNKNMPWNKWQSSNWQGQWKKGNNSKKEEPLLRGYDGKRIDIEDGEQPSSSWQSYGWGDSAIREENKQLKEAMKFVLSKVATPEEMPEEIVSLVKENPREALRQKQKELNAERKALTKIIKTREQLDKTQERFQRWKKNITAGVNTEEKRHQTEVAEMQTRLQSLERGESGEPAPIEVESDGEENKTLKKELADVKDTFEKFATYTSAVEQKNANMLEQMQMQIATLVGCLQGTAIPTIPTKSSPEQMVRPRAACIKIKEEKDADQERRKRERSRSPPASGETSSKMAQASSFDQAIQQEMTQYPEKCQMLAWQMMQEKPEEYQSLEVVQDLLRNVHHQLLQESAISETSKNGETTSSALPVAHSQALCPFRKTVNRFRQSAEGPYTPKGEKPKPLETTPGGGQFLNVDVMS